MRRLVVIDERKKSHEASVLDGLGQHSLVTGACPSGGSRCDLSVGGDELLQEFHILVIDVLDVVLGEVADLLTCESLFYKH